MEAKLNSHANGATNGSLKGGKKMNGINGINSGLNGHTMTPRRGTPLAKTSPSYFARIFSIAARLFTWYSIFTLLFRCPATLDACDDTSPKICKGYFQVKQAVTPHVTPYYDTYAAPYVEIAKPYYNTVDRVLITPTRTYAVKYGGPQLTKAQALGLAQWEKNVQPQFLKYQGMAKSQYDQTVAPHVNKATTAVAPYYDIARTNALQTYHEILLPSYNFVQPYALHSYDVASAFTVKTAVPSTLWAWNKTYLFLDATVWPHVRDVYVAKVEPQLARITDRLSRYKEIKPMTAVVEEVETQTTKSTFAKPSTSISSTTASVKTTSQSLAPESTAVPQTTEAAQLTVGIVPNADSAADPAQDEIRAQAAKTVAEDLEMWQTKFTKAADVGAIEIEERVEELSSRLIQDEAQGKGKPLVADLEQIVKVELASLKKTILTILEQHKDSQEAGKVDEEVSAAVRGAGLKIKDKAQEIRTWREKYEQQMEIDVTTAAQEHIMILEGIRDLALQKIGMRWAWTDGITYKHWQKFHKLRHLFDEWVDELKELVITHPGLSEAQAAGNDVESEGMAIAGEAARELGTLKQVASWKALAGDFSDDFDASTMKLAAEAAQKKAAEAAEALKSAAEDVQEGVHSIVDKVEDGASSVSEAISEGVSSVLPSKSTASEAAAEETVTVSLSEVTPEDVETSVLPPLESLTSEPTHSATDLASDSDAAETPIVADAATSAADILPTSVPVDGPEQVEETIVESPEEPSATPQSSTTTVKSAMFGAAAQSVPSRQPIMDEDIGSSFASAASVVQSDVPHTITSAAQSVYTAALAQAADKYSSAMSAVSAQISGEPKPAHEEMLSSVSSAYFGAIGSANSRLNEALSAASTGVYGTPTATANWLPEMPTLPSVEWESVQSIAQQNLKDSVSWAGEQYESAKVAIGVAEPTPSTASQRYEKLMDQAKHNYYAGLGVAHARYSEFLSAASTAASSLTATPTPTNIQGSASSVASVAGETGSSVVSVASESAASAASAASEAAVSVASSVGEAASGAGDSVVENWDFLVSRVSSQIYGAPTPTPWYENLYAAAGGYAAQAGDYAASATDVAADYASTAGDYAAGATDVAASYASDASGYAADSVSSATSVAGDYAAAASSAAASQYAIVSSIVSELVVGKEPTFSESVYSRLAAVYESASATVVSAGSEATSSAASAASVASATVSSVAEKVKDTVEHLKDEL